MIPEFVSIGDIDLAIDADLEIIDRFCIRGLLVFGPMLILYGRMDIGEKATHGDFKEELWGQRVGIQD